MSIIERITLLLEKTDRTMKELCQHIGVSETTASNWKKRHTDPPAKLLVPICEFFGISVEYLLTGEDQDQARQELPDDESTVLRYFRSLDQVNKNIALGELAKLYKDQNLALPDVSSGT